MSIPLYQPRTRPRFEESAAEHARLTVVPRRPQTAPRVPFVVLVSVLLVGGVAGLLLFNTSMQQASFTGTAMETKATALKAREQALKMQLDTMRDPQRVAVRARRLGMVPSTSPAFIQLSDGRVYGTAEPARAGTGMRITPLPTRKPKNLRPAPVIVEASPQQPATSGKTGRDTSAASQDQGGAAGTKSQHAHR